MGGKMKLFGEYLIEKGLVNSEVLVDALVEQVRNLPTMAEIVRTHKVLPAVDIISVFKLESQNGSSFVVAAKSLGLWTPEVEAVVSRELKLRRIPLGQILVRRGHLTIEKMAMALDEFLGELPIDARPANRPPSSAPVAPLVSSPKGEALQYEFSNERMVRIESFFAQMLSTVPRSEELRVLADELHLLRGTARLAQAPRLERLIALMENATGSLSHQQPDLERLARLAVASGDGFQLVRSLVAALIGGSEEAVYFTKVGNVTSFDRAYAALQRVRDELSVAS
jgi:hypothetical protein